MQLEPETSQLAAMNVESHSLTDFSKWGEELECLAQAGVRKEIAEHKAHRRSIFYSRNGVLIMELADGRCFEYHLLEDGTREIIREVVPR